MAKKGLFVDLPTSAKVGLVALAMLVGSFNGRAGAQMLRALLKDYLKSRRRDGLKEQTFRTTLYRLHRDGLIENPLRGIWKVTPKGHQYLEKRLEGDVEERIRLLKLKEKARNNPDTLIVFDIPEKERYKRDKLRFELLAYGFIPLQKSVWVGCGSLPIELIEYFRDQGVLNYIHILGITKKGTVI